MSEEKQEQEQVAGEVDPTSGAAVTPEEGAAVESVPEEKPVETEEQKSEKFFEKRHQGMMEKLTARFGPEVVQQLKDDQFASERPTEESTPTGATPTEAFDPDDVVTVAMQLKMQQESEQRILNALDARDTKREEKQELASQQAQYTEEWNAADAAISTIVNDLKIPQNVHSQILAEVNGYNIPTKHLGGPIGFARAFYRLAKGYKPTDTPPGSTPEEIAASDRARQAGLMAQPAGATVGTVVPDPQRKAADGICEDDEPFKAT